jgi:hypothetical protein
MLSFDADKACFSQTIFKHAFALPKKRARNFLQNVGGHIAASAQMNFGPRGGLASICKENASLRKTQSKRVSDSNLHC